MKAVQVRLVRPVAVVFNTGRNSTGHRWGKIRCGLTGKVLHTGQIGYIKKVAKERYHVDLKEVR